MKKMIKVIVTPLLMIAALVIGLYPQAASAAPAFQLPFPCGQTWTGQTRTDHSPANAVDFNRTDDLGDPVVASAAGKVITVKDLGSTSYGKYVVVEHSGSWTTYYAHLNSFAVTVGEAVSTGEKIGTVGSTGGSTGPHLHFEQRLNGSAQKVVFNGAQALYWGSKSYTSKNACSGTSYSGTVNTTGANLTVRSGPGTGYTAVGSVADGATIHFTCQKRGSTVTGTYGTSDLWNYIGTGYVADAYIYTGSDGQIAPTCP